jgi:EAL domain-containing protein (putative c-di-GMP-specific phosphodiesterase class I)
MSVIAEGVETGAQLRELRSLACDLVQGHLISPALSVDEASRLIDRMGTTDRPNNSHALPG